MKQSHRWKANNFLASHEIPNNFLASHEIPNTLRNHELYYRVHKNPPVVPIRIQMNPVHKHTSYLFKVKLH
jgi:hypothetical protein